jgi:hypothetical protein
MVVTSAVWLAIGVVAAGTAWAVRVVFERRGKRAAAGRAYPHQATESVR